MVRTISRTVLFLTLICITLSGCWDYSEINDYSIIAGSGVDLTENDDTQVTIEQIGWNDAGIQTNEQKNIISYTGSSCFEAYSSLLLLSGKPNYSSHATTLILGQSYAENGISELIDMLIRLEGSRLSMNVVIADNMEAKEFFTKTKADQNISSFYLPSMLKNCNEQGFSLNPTLFQVGNTLVNERQSLCIPMISTLSTPKSKTPEVVISGSAIFNGDKMTTTLNNEQTKTLVMLLNQPKKTTLAIKENTQEYAFELNNLNTSIKPLFNKNSISFEIKICADASLSELNNNINLTPAEVAELEASISSKLTQDVKTFISHAYGDLNADVIGLSDKIYKKSPTYWENNQPLINTALRNPDIKTTTDITLVSTHLLRKSIIK